MALRVLFLIFALVVFINVVLVSVGLIMNVNLYEKYGKQILNFFIIFFLAIIVLYVVLAVVGSI